MAKRPGAPRPPPDRAPDRAFDLDGGTTQLYQDPCYYDYEYQSRRDDVRWYGQHYLDAEGPVLELGVGSGRIALPAVRRGAQVLGLDLSQEMLRQAAAGRARLPKGRRAALQLVRGDMRRFAFERRFALISCPFNAFQHLYNRRAVELCLGRVRESLVPDGLFLLDVLMPDFEYLARSHFKRYPGRRFLHPTWREHYLYAEQTAYDGLTQINQMRFLYDRSEPPSAGPARGPESYQVALSHRYFFPAELEALLHYNGFEVLACHGDFNEGPLRADSESQIVLSALR